MRAVLAATFALLSLLCLVDLPVVRAGKGKSKKAGCKAKTCSGFVVSDIGYFQGAFTNLGMAGTIAQVNQYSQWSPDEVTAVINGNWPKNGDVCMSAKVNCPSAADVSEIVAASGCPSGKGVKKRLADLALAHPSVSVQQLQAACS